MSASSELRRTLVLPAGVDLHARPAGALVRTAASYEAGVAVSAGDRRADAKSILQVLSLGATGGSAIELSASGPDASAALDAIAELLHSFG